MSTSTAPMAGWRPAAVFIDCPREGCGGGLTASDGSYTLLGQDVARYTAGEVAHCDECGMPMRVPGAAINAATRLRRDI